MSIRGLGIASAAWASLLVMTGRADPAAPVPDPLVVRQQFLQAMTNVAAGDEARDDPALRAYPLYPYLQAERIRQGLANPATVAAADRRAADFLATYGLQPVAAQLRRSWLTSLAQREQWSTFLEAFRDAGASDELRCQALSARIATGQTAQLGPTLVRQWLTTRDLPECERPYAWGFEHAIITSELVERRAHMALETGNTGLAKPLIARLPESEAAPLRLWTQLLESPQRTLDLLLNQPTAAVLPEALRAGWSRLARQDPDAAVDRYARLVRTRNLTSESSSAFALDLALPLAWQRDARAEEFFARVSSRDLDDSALEWRARAALWAGNWSLVTQIHRRAVRDRPAKCALALLERAGRRTGGRCGPGAQAVCLPGSG